MGDLFKLAVAYMLAPALVVGLLASAYGLAALLTALVAAVLLVGLPLALGARSLWRRRHRFRKKLRDMRSPVRRRRPRPAAWHQWR